MAQHQIMTGARAVLRINNQPVGIFSRVSWSVNNDAAPAHVLGRYAPAEITYVSQEAVNIQAVGFRIIDKGAHVAASLPKLQELLNHDSISLSVVDRRTGKTIFQAFHVRPLSYSTDITARGQVEIAVNFLAVRAEDESGAQQEAAGSVAAPSFP